MTGSPRKTLEETNAVFPEKAENRRRWVPSNKERTRAKIVSTHAATWSRMCRNEPLYATISAMASTDPGPMDSVVAANGRAMEWI